MAMTTKSIKLPKVPIDLLAKASADAVLKGMTLPEYLTEVLTKALHKDGKK